MTETTTAEHSPAESATPARMHRYSSYIHVGPGADSCACIKEVTNGRGETFLAPDGSCEDPEHFHGWVRLPNQFERDSLREKASAAEARQLRALRDAESDSRIVLDGEVEALVLGGNREALVGEIVGQNFMEDHLQALKEIAEEADGDYDLIDEDRERLRALELMGEEERPSEEFEQLRVRLARHTELVNERRDQIEKPKREAVEGKLIEELGEIVRELRIESAGNQARRQAYGKWQWYICTFKPKALDKPGFPSLRAFGSIDEFSGAPPEVIDAIASSVLDLEREAGEALKGSF